MRADFKKGVLGLQSATHAEFAKTVYKNVLGRCVSEVSIEDIFYAALIRLSCEEIILFPVNSATWKDQFPGDPKQCWKRMTKQAERYSENEAGMTLINERCSLMEEGLRRVGDGIINDESAAEEDQTEGEDD